jgi:hypothetical protein
MVIVFPDVEDVGSLSLGQLHLLFFFARSAQF